MFSRLHNRLGTAGFVLAIVALVAAVAGTAFAAQGLNSKQKKEVKKIARSVANPGPAGAAGAAGANGAAGPEGAPWTTGGTLPSGKTETGTWAEVFESEDATAISFSIPLAAPLDAAHVKRVNVGDSVPGECNNGSGAAPSAANPEAAPGFLCVFAGQFDAGGKIGAGGILNPSTGESGGGISGAAVLLQSAAEDFGKGTFAVTAP
jgi:hypothetical protein